MNWEDSYAKHMITARRKQERWRIFDGVYSSALLELFAPCHKENTANQRATENRCFFCGIQGYFRKKMQVIHAVSTFSRRQVKHFIKNTKISSCNFVNNTLLKLMYETRVVTM